MTLRAVTCCETCAHWREHERPPGAAPKEGPRYWCAGPPVLGAARVPERPVHGCGEHQERRDRQVWVGQVIVVLAGRRTGVSLLEGACWALGIDLPTQEDWRWIRG